MSSSISRVTLVVRDYVEAVGFFLETDDFWGDYRHMQSCGVRFNEQPRKEAYATVIVFQDLCGNKWDLLQRK